MCSKQCETLALYRVLVWDHGMDLDLELQLSPIPFKGNKIFVIYLKDMRGVR